MLDTPPGTPPPKSGDADAEAIIGGRVDASIVYCSGRDRYARILLEVKLITFPPELQVGPEYGLTVMKDAPSRRDAPGTHHPVTDRPKDFWLTKVFARYVAQRMNGKGSRTREIRCPL